MSATRRTSLVRKLLALPDAPRADCQDGEALCLAAAEGHVEMVELLLSWSENAPRADCRDGEALVQAAQGGHVGVMWTLQEFLDDEVSD